ncbi:single-stranded DNA-binding protein [Candidatus Woesebacteria bacterium]|nr:single-stranded DNA-binding protein [Candidatus Woesebacteria bacterium]
MSSRSINKVVLLGNLTRDPELKYTPNGTAVCTFGLATNRSWTTADGQTKDDVQYHRVVAWQKLAELCGKLLVKGSKVYLEGRIAYRDYMDKNNQQKFITEIILDDFILLSSSKKYQKTEESEDDKPTEKGKKDEEEKDEDTAAPEGKADDESEEEEKEEESNNQEKEKDDEEDVNPDDIPF